MPNSLRRLIRVVCVMGALSLAVAALAAGFILGLREGEQRTQAFRLDGRVNACEARLEARLAHLDGPAPPALRAYLLRLPDECASGEVVDRLDPVLIEFLSAAEEAPPA